MSFHFSEKFNDIVLMTSAIFIVISVALGRKKKIEHRVGLNMLKNEYSSIEYVIIKDYLWAGIFPARACSGATLAVVA